MSIGSPSSLHPLVAVNLGIRFLLELLMLGALGWTGVGLPSSRWLSVVLAIALPVAAAGVWAMWIAPKASRRLQDPWRLLVELVLFAAAAAGLAAIGHPLLALAFAVVLVANIAVLRLAHAEH